MALIYNDICFQGLEWALIAHFCMLENIFGIFLEDLVSCFQPVK